MKELREILGYEGLYWADAQGRICSKRGGKTTILKPARGHNGYELVGLCLRGKQKTYRVHRLVWEAFNGRIPDGMTIDHKDANRTNNALTNLQLLTQRVNLHKGWVQSGRKLPVGVSYVTRVRKYVAAIYYKRKRYHLGHFQTPEEAHNAYLEKLASFAGE